MILYLGIILLLILLGLGIKTRNNYISELKLISIEEAANEVIEKKIDIYLKDTNSKIEDLEKLISTKLESIENLINEKKPRDNFDSDITNNLEKWILRYGKTYHVDKNIDELSSLVQRMNVRSRSIGKDMYNSNNNYYLQFNLDLNNTIMEDTLTDERDSRILSQVLKKNRGSYTSQAIS